MKSFRTVLTLGICAGFLGGLLATVAHFTEPYIEANLQLVASEQSKQLEALARVYIETNKSKDNPSAACDYKISIIDVTSNGYGGTITYKAAFVGQELIGARVSSHLETPGFSYVLEPDDWLGQFGIEPVENIDTVSRATITTRSMLQSIRKLALKHKETAERC